MAELDFSRAVKLMAGRELSEVYPRLSHHSGCPVLKWKAAEGGAKLPQVDLTLHEGEIFGLAGTVGAGRTEMLRMLFGLERMRRAEVFLDGKPATFATPGKRLRAGIGLASEDRESEGLMGNLSIADNLTLAHMGDFGYLGFFSRQWQYMSALDWMQKLHIRARSPIQPVGQLSGGNQQKIALGRLLQQKLRILLLDEPTRGIDVATKAQLYELLGELASEGKAILFVSSYLPELLGVCDTLGVMRQGRVVAVRAAAEWTETELIKELTGVDTDKRSPRASNP
jgi:ribose transport system ATP-binding protein